MSDDQLDDDLKKRIKQVFDNYEDDTANEGWLLLREKYPEKEEDRGVFWLWWRIAGVAALLLMALGVGLWFNGHETGKQNIAQHNKKNNITDTASTSKIAAAITGDKKQPADSTTNLATQQQTMVAAHTTAIAKDTPYAQSGVNPTVQSANTGNAVVPAKVDTSVKKNLAYQLENKAKPLDVIDSPSTANTTVVIANTKPLTLISTRPAGAPPVKEQPKAVADNQVSKGMQALFDKEAQNKATQNTETQKTITDKKVAFSIFAATYVNYAKGSNKQFNTGGGATADIRLTDNLRLSTGVSIGQNTLSYANNTASVMPVALMAAASHNYTASSTGLLYSVTPASSNLNANLVNLDVPVDLKYVFNPQKGNTYVSAGFSSGTFINETYNTTYNYNGGNGTSVQQSSDPTHKSFDNFYFAQMLNVSFGVGYPVGKNQLIIEPFFKYPLNGMGDEHLLFGSGGINLKFNFDPPKSKH